MSAAQPIHLRVLGPLDVRRAAERVMVAGTKPRAVLTMLGLHAGSVVTGDVLRAVIWGDDTPRTAHKALQTHISVLRRALGDDLVVTEGTGWRLVASTDALTFEARVHDAREAAAQGDPVTAAAHLTEALDVWRGPPELPATRRAQAEATRWIEARETAFDDRVDALIKSGHGADLVAELEAAVGETPLRERRWALLCHALYRAGRQGDALATYQRARSVLRAELGVEPGPELQRLEKAILAHDQALGAEHPRNPSTASSSAEPRPDDDARPPLPAPPTTFVGRHDEMARLSRLLSEHRIVTVVGPGGVGKTRLTLACAESMAERFPAGVWFVDLTPAGPEFIAQRVAAAIGVQERAEVPLEEAIWDRLRPRRSLVVLDNCEHVIESVSLFTERLATACPRVVVLATSRERLGSVGERVFTLPPLSIVGPDTDGPKGSEAETLFLDRARAVAPEFDADPDVIAEVCARCDGLPLAIELAAARCASLGIDGLLAALDDRLRLLVAGRATGGRHRSVRAVLDWSHDLLNDDEQRVFRRVGVFAGSFDLAAAAAVVGDEHAGATGPAGLADVVGRLTDKNLLVHLDDPLGSRWRLLGVVQSYARGKLAEYGEDADVGARHRRWASDTAARLEHHLDIGMPWRDEFDAATADLHLALAAPPGQEEAHQRLTLALALARLHARRGAFTLAQAAYEEAMTVARTAGDAEQLGRAALGASLVGMLFGVAQSGRAVVLEEALAAQGNAATGMRARLMARLATELYWSTDRLRSLDLAEEAVALARELRDDDAVAHALYARHYVTRGPGTAEERLTVAGQIMDAARRAGETQLELAGRAARAVALLETGELSAMDAEVDALTDIANRLDHPEFQWYAAVYRLVRALMAGRYDDADGLAADAADSARYAPEFSVGLFFAEAITDLRVPAEWERRERSSRLAEMADRFPRVLVWRCLELLDHCAENSTAPRPARELHAMSDELADDLLAQDLRDGHWLVACCLLAEAAAALHRVPMARSLTEALQPFAGAFAVAGRVAAFRGSVTHALGLLSITLGDPVQAVEDLEAAVAHHERVGARPYHVRSLNALSAALEARDRPGDHERAAAVRSQAGELSRG